MCGHRFLRADASFEGDDFPVEVVAESGLVEFLMKAVPGLQVIELDQGEEVPGTLSRFVVAVDFVDSPFDLFFPPFQDLGGLKVERVAFFEGVWCQASLCLQTRRTPRGWSWGV